MSLDVSALQPVLQDPVVLNAVKSLLIMFLGVIFAKLVGYVVGTAFRGLGMENRVKTAKTAKSFRRGIELTIVALSFLWALSVLDIVVAQSLVSDLWAIAPNILAGIIILFLGIILVNLLVDIFEVLLRSAEIEDYFQSMGISEEMFGIGLRVVRLFLWLVVLNIALSNMGIPVGIMETTLNAISIVLVLLVAAFTYYSTKDVVANILIGSYLRSRYVLAGQRVRINGHVGEVKEVRSIGLLVKLDTGYNMLIPNQQVLKERLLVKRAKAEVEDLEALRLRFVAQKPSLCGPASAQMLLAFLGYDVGQEEIAKKSKSRSPGGTGPNNLIKGVEKITKKKVRGALIRFDDIKNLKEELHSWLADGALSILWFRKEALFPGSRTGHYVLCVGMEGDELIVIDPNKRTGGVYLVDYRDMEEGMAEWDKSRGYLVFAPRGTSAFWRISQGLLYSDSSLYKDLGRTMERQLKKLQRKSRVFENVMPDYVKERLTSFRETEKVKKVWVPEDE